MKNKLIHVGDYTVITNPIFFHRENDYEWKYVGIWADLLDDQSKHIINQHFPTKDLSSLFIAFGHYTSTLDIVKKNLINRNKEIQEEILKKN